MTVNADGASGPWVSGKRASGISESRVRALLANVADMVTISDRDGRITYASPATEKVSGYTPEEFMTRDPFGEIHPEDRPRCEEAMTRLASSPGLSLELEHRVRRKDGTWGWVEGTFTSLFDDPDVGGLLATVRDITDRKNAEEALRASEARQTFLLELGDRVRGLTDAAEIAAATAESLGRHLGVARCLYGEVDPTDQHFRVERDWTVGTLESMAGRVRFDDLGDLLEVYRSGRTLVSYDSGEDLRTTGDEEAYAGIGVVRSSIGVPLVKGGRFAAAFGVHHTEPRRWTKAEVKLVEETADRTWDAVERARAEAALRESEQRRHFALDSAQMGTFLWHVDEDRGEPDAQMLALFGLSEGGSLTLARALTTLIHPDDRTGYAEAVARATDPAGDGRLRTEIRVVHPDGSDRWLAITAQTVFETGPRRAVRMSGVATDITERRRTEAESERLRTREAAMWAEVAERERISRELHDRVAHSMGVVYQSLQLHKALVENAPERARQKLALAEETARNALDQTRNLALELRHSVAEETEEGIAEALRSLLDTSAPDGVITDLSFSGDESLVPPDVGAQVYLVMREAIRNALKHAGCEAVEVRLGIQPGELVGTVADDGVGFDRATVPDGQQEGIGLRSMRERAEMVGGRLNLASRPGDGTTVEIRLPLTAGDPSADGGAPAG